MVELLQFQQWIDNYCNQYYKDDTLEKRHWICISECVPKSQIVHSSLSSSKLSANDNDDHIVIELMAKAHRLYRKYILIDCPLEINISHELRTSFIQVMHKMDVWIAIWDKNIDNLSNLDKIKTIYGYFTPVIEELAFLLDTSMTRFKATTKYLALDIHKRKSWRNSFQIKLSGRNSNNSLKKFDNVHSNSTLSAIRSELK